MESPNLSSPVTLEDHVLWFGQIKLYDDKIVISGWTWTGPVEETIRISDITQFEKWTVEKGQNFRLNREGGPPIRGRIEKGAGFWGSKLEEDERVELKRRH